MGIKFLSIFLVFGFFFMFGNMTTVFSEEPILITVSGKMDQAIFDGKWTHWNEWKPTSLDTLRYDDGMVIHLRTAHQENFVYVLADVVNDVTLDKGSDRALICFDTMNDKSLVSDENDYCFFATLGEKSKPILQGGTSLIMTSNFKQIGTFDGYIGLSSPSDENDRYSKIPHSTYEFRIPTELIGRSDVYGFYMSVYDDSSKKSYNWPQNIELKNNFNIPSPSLWGEIISPDKSIPEFPFALIIIAISLSVMILVTKTKNIFSFKV